jgi:hypothetical protein
MIFTVGYKSIWMAFVAYPLWRAGTLEGSSAQPIFESFLALPLLALVIPWGYAWRTFVAWPKRRGVGPSPVGAA